MKSLFFFFTFILANMAFAVSLPADQKLAKIDSLTTNGTFPSPVIQVTYTRACHQRFVDFLTRSQIAAGKNYFEVGAAVEETNLPCQMNEPAFITESASFRINSGLPVVLLALDLSIDLHPVIKPSESR